MKGVLILFVLIAILVYVLQRNNKKEKIGGSGSLGNVENTNQIVEYNKANAKVIYEELKNHLQ